MTNTITDSNAQGAEENHTKGKWKYEEDTVNSIRIFDEHGTIAEVIGENEITEEQIANAQRIVKAVNMHDELKDALQMICNYASQKKFDMNVLKQMAGQGKELVQQAEEK